jgi:hypothetical protein
MAAMDGMLLHACLKKSSHTVSVQVSRILDSGFRTHWFIITERPSKHARVAALQKVSAYHYNTIIVYG